MNGQAEFTGAIFNPSAETPSGLVDPHGKPARNRFDVYRNNVAASLTEALELGYPIIRKIVGDAFFKAMAGVFLRAHPPSSPLMIFYGQEMPEFLHGFEPVKHLGYLPDVARLEWACRTAYHAADAPPITPDKIANSDLMSSGVSFAPAVHVIRSDWPLYGIWLANTQADAPKPNAEPQDVLVTRPEYDPVVSLLPSGGGRFVTELMKGASLAAATSACGDQFDPGPILNLMLKGGGITGLKQGIPE